MTAQTSLRERAAGATGNGTGAEVERRTEGPTLAQQVQQMEQQFALAMPRGVEARQLIRDALTCLRTTPKLGECQPSSVLGGLMTCAQLGLRPGVLGHAWLLPFWDKNANNGQGKPKGAYKAQLVIGYQGLVDLAHRSGKVASLIARTVYSNDTFDVDYGLADSLVHKPALNGRRGEPIAYYAVAKFTTGGHAFIVMTLDEMREYRDRFATARNKQGEVVGPWRDNFEGMAHKTCVRQLAKWMPKSTELAQALAADEGIRIDLDPTQDVAAVTEHDVIDGEVVDEQPAPATGEQASQAPEPSGDGAAGEQ